jgi:hypothetical protein
MIYYQFISAHLLKQTLLHSAFCQIVSSSSCRSTFILNKYLSFPKPEEEENKAGGVWLKGHTGKLIWVIQSSPIKLIQSGLYQIS